MARRESPLSRSNSRIKHHSPQVRHSDSPSRQLHVELEETFAQLQLYESERQRLYAFNRKSVQDELDARELAQAVAHKAEIDEAIAKHEIVRQQAIAVLEAHIREEEERRRRREEEERRQKEEEEARRRAEEQRRIQEERERKAKEEKAKAESARRAAAEKAKAEEEERSRKQREATAEQEKRAQQARAKADAEAQAAKEKDEAAKAAAAKAQPVQALSKTNLDAEPSWSAVPEIRHKHYLDLHKNLKTFRKEFWDNSRKDPALKPHVGDMRRVLKLSVNQLGFHDRRSNLRATRQAKATLLQALNEIPSQPVIVNDYLPPHLGLLDKNTTTIPSLVLYLISMFSKYVVIKFANESALVPEAAEPVGTLVAQIFSMPQLQFTRNVPSPNSGLHYSAFGGAVPTPPLEPSSVSLISILICKFHATAPILFGISGTESTTAGKLRLGWRREFTQDGQAQKSFVDESKHQSRVGGLGSGYASIALRNFSKTELTNPYPPYHFWESLSYIVNTDPSDIQPTHLSLLKGMFETSLSRFVEFFGDEGIAALRKAFVDLPQRLPPAMIEKGPGLAAITLPDVWKREKSFSLN